MSWQTLLFDLYKAKAANDRTHRVSVCFCGKDGGLCLLTFVGGVDSVAGGGARLYQSRDGVAAVCNNL